MFPATTMREIQEETGNGVIAGLAGSVVSTNRSTLLPALSGTLPNKNRLGPILTPEAFPAVLYGVTTLAITVGRWTFEVSNVVTTMLPCQMPPESVKVPLSPSATARLPCITGW